MKSDCPLSLLPRVKTRSCDFLGNYYRVEGGGLRATEVEFSFSSKSGAKELLERLQSLKASRDPSLLRVLDHSYYHQKSLCSNRHLVKVFLEDIDLSLKEMLDRGDKLTIEELTNLLQIGLNAIQVAHKQGVSVALMPESFFKTRDGRLCLALPLEPNTSKELFRARLIQGRPIYACPQLIWELRDARLRGGEASRLGLPGPWAQFAPPDVFTLGLIVLEAWLGKSIQKIYDGPKGFDPSFLTEFFSNPKEEIQKDSQLFERLKKILKVEPKPGYVNSPGNRNNNLTTFQTCVRPDRPSLPPPPQFDLFKPDESVICSPEVKKTVDSFVNAMRPLPLKRESFSDSVGNSQLNNNPPTSSTSQVTNLTTTQPITLNIPPKFSTSPLGNLAFSQTFNLNSPPNFQSSQSHNLSSTQALTYQSNTQKNSYPETRPQGRTSHDFQSPLKPPIIRHSINSQTNNHSHINPSFNHQSPTQQSQIRSSIVPQSPTNFNFSSPGYKSSSERPVFDPLVLNSPTSKSPSEQNIFPRNIMTISELFTPKSSCPQLLSSPTDSTKPLPARPLSTQQFPFQFIPSNSPQTNPLAVSSSHNINVATSKPFHFISTQSFSKNIPNSQPINLSTSTGIYASLKSPISKGVGKEN